MHIHAHVALLSVAVWGACLAVAKEKRGRRKEEEEEEEEEKERKGEEGGHGHLAGRLVNGAKGERTPASPSC